MTGGSAILHLLCVTVKSQPVNIVHVQACHEMPHFRCIALHCIHIVTLPCSHNVAPMYGHVDGTCVGMGVCFIVGPICTT